MAMLLRYVFLYIASGEFAGLAGIGTPGMGSEGDGCGTYQAKS
jgi:hypothetical protein